MTLNKNGVLVAGKNISPGKYNMMVKSTDKARSVTVNSRVSLSSDSKNLRMKSKLFFGLQ